MRVLILSGTQFVGRQIVETLLSAGHMVSILTRGLSLDELPIQVERLRGDRDKGALGMQALAGRVWDVCVDVSGYTPRQVRPSAERLRKSMKRYVFVRAVSVYGDPTQRPVRETHPRMPPASDNVTEVNGETYGTLKVACEDIVQEIFADRCTLLRPQIVVGPHDPRGRYSHMTEFVLPLFRPEYGPRSGLMDVSNQRAVAAGLTLTDPAVTARDMRAWILGRDLTPALLPEKEVELIRIARQAGRSNILT